MGVELPLCIVVTLSQNAVMFSRGKLSVRSFVLFVLLPCGSFKIDISTHITSVKVIVLKISGQTICTVNFKFNVKSTYTIRFLEDYKANFPNSN